MSKQEASSFGNKGNNMRLLTYGQLPKFHEFRKAFNNEVKSSYYRIDCPANSTDCRMLQTLELDQFGSYCSDDAGVEMTLKDDALYALLKALVDISRTVCLDEGHTSEEQAEWAGEFASSILTTLGFEWI